MTPNPPTNYRFDQLWNLPREAALDLLSAHAAQISFMVLDEAVLDRELGELDFLIHTTRNRIFHDARERNRLSNPSPPSPRSRNTAPHAPRPTIDDLL